MRKELATELEPLRENALDAIRGASGRSVGGDGHARMPGGQSRWSAGKDLSWEPLRIERVCEVKYDHLQGDALPPCDGLPALAARQAAGGLPLRPARGHDALRAREGLRRGGPPPALTSVVLWRVVRDRAPPAPAAAPAARAAGSRGSASRCGSGRASRRRARRLPPVRRRLGMTRPPALQTRERIVLLLRAADFDQRVLRHAPP